MPNHSYNGRGYRSLVYPGEKCRENVERAELFSIKRWGRLRRQNERWVSTAVSTSSSAGSSDAGRAPRGTNMHGAPASADGRQTGGGHRTGVRAGGMRVGHLILIDARIDQHEAAHLKARARARHHANADGPLGRHEHNPHKAKSGGWPIRAAKKP